MTSSLLITVFALLASEVVLGARVKHKDRARVQADLAKDADSKAQETANLAEEVGGLSAKGNEEAGGLYAIGDDEADMNPIQQDDSLSAPPLHWSKYAARGKDLEEFIRNVDLNKDLESEFALLQEDAKEAANSTSDPGPSERKTFVPAHWRDRVARFGKWVGGGSFGKVYLAKVNCDPSNEKTMAFKVQKSNTQVDAEIAMQESFDHLNIIKAVDHYKGPKDGQVTMMMEAAGGGDMDSLLKKTRPDHSEIGRLMYETLIATKYIHSKGVVHSDYKPENIMLSTKCSGSASSSPACHAKVADFGVSCSFRKYRDCSGMAGTPTFMSPEMVTSGSRSTSDDLWALGVTLHLLLNKGQYPSKIDSAWRTTRDTNSFLRKIGYLRYQRWKYTAKTRNSPLERLLAGLLVADPTYRMSIDQAAALALQAAQKGPEANVIWAGAYKVPQTPADSGAPSCWQMCETSKCFNLNPLKPCLINAAKTATTCGGQDEPADVEMEADSKLIEIVMNRGFSGKLGFVVNAKQTVSKLSPGGAAERAGLKIGDHIVTIQHKAWESFSYERRKEIIVSYPRVVLEVYRSFMPSEHY